MKCTHCGHENKEGAKFCTYCGTPFVIDNKEQAYFIEIAEGYTGNLAVAKRIVAQNPLEIRAISVACIAWIKENNPTLFSEAGTYVPNNPILNTIGNREDTLRDLDYEERITVLMHCEEKMDTTMIASELGLSEENVKYYLQSAYEKVHPTNVQTPINHSLDKKTVRRRTVHKKGKPVESDTGIKLPKQISLQAKIIAAVVAALIIGGFIGVKQYARSEYQKGIKLLENEEYDAAIEPLLNAKRYGGNESAGLKLGDVYYYQGNYEKALQEYQSCREGLPDLDNAMIRTYEKLADASVNDKNYGTAAEYLQSQYDLDGDERTQIRLKAANNSGTYTDENGNIFDVWGNPIKLCVVKKEKALYQVDFEYNDDHTLKSMKEYISAYTSKVNYNQFIDGQEMEASWILNENGTVSYSVTSSAYDEQNNLVQQTITTPSSIKKSSITYTYDGDAIQSSQAKTSTRTINSTYTYKDNQLVEKSNDDGTSTSYKYDRDGNLVHETTIKENGDIIMDAAYEYDDQGRLKEKTVKNNDTDSILPYAANEDVLYTYTKLGNPYTLLIRSNNSQVAKGYYIENVGWIILYEQAYTNE